MGGNLAKEKKDGVTEDRVVYVDKYDVSADEIGEQKGEGGYYYQNGDRYDGDWKNGLKHGYGIYTFADGKR